MLRNTAFHLGGQMIAVLSALVCLPIAFRNLGPAQFGVLMLLWSILAYATLFDFGIGRAVARATASAAGRGQTGNIPRVFRAAIRMQLVVGVVAGAALFIAAPFIPHVLQIPPALVSDAKMAIYAVALSLPVLLIIQSEQGVLEGLERFDVVAYVRTPINVATYAVPAAGALAGWSLATIFVVLLAFRVCAAAALLLIYRRLVTNEPAGDGAGDVRELVRFGGWLTISALVIGAMAYGDRFLIAALRDVGDVAQYGAPYDLAAKLLLIPGSIGAVLFPALSRSSGTNSLDEAMRRSNNARRASIAVVLPLGFIMIIGAQFILRTWLGPQISDQAIVAFRILVAATCLHAISFAPVVLIEAWGRSDIIAKYHLAELPVYALILVIGIQSAGIVGAAWAWAARSVWLLIWADYYVRRWRANASRDPQAIPA